MQYKNTLTNPDEISYHLSGKTSETIKIALNFMHVGMNSNEAYFQ